MTGAIVLCGGRSRRMGQPKAWLPFGPEVLLQRVVRILRDQVGPVVVVASADQNLPILPESVVVARDVIADQGPLHGLATGLRAIPPKTELVYLTATDAPFLQPGWIGRLVELIGPADLAIPANEVLCYPLAAVYRAGPTRIEADNLLAQGHRRLLDLTGRLRTIRVDPEDLRAIDPDLETLENLNTIEEYEQALRSRDRDRSERARRSDA